ncbi:ATP-binding protein [Actinoallomurus soli]|uniref:ATP-binding protein n=1 Tax=Actinoallomurus soli TaxID=2952535 RepID=UPI0020924744|nr:LuxR C-terminal-related transcriptional regulator [Actinoallomurus soli]MCO5967071.1 LuxR C-terminal-related transcriptional regulator [Actinoallomurus soli]
MTTFVGRRRELAEVKRLLSVSRIVTLTGPGGVGKSRLALRVAAELRRAYPDGVWLAELAELDNPKLLAQTLVAALGITARSVERPGEVLVEHLAGKRTLVILDNCEHLLQECGLLARTLLREVPELHILATSLQPLGIFSEQTYVVPTLSLPCDGAPHGTQSAMSDAVRLFTERAEAVLPGFAVTDRNREIVERICRRLDGLPLAIELAVVRLRALSVEQLLDRLDDRFRLLSMESRAVASRHQTLRALIDWSYALCTEKERLLWARVSVFTGSLDLEAAEEVCAGDGIGRGEIVQLVIGLVEKSVLAREEGPGGVRFRLLETIRRYGRERLADSGEKSTVERRYRDYYRRVARESKARLFGPAQVETLNRLRVEYPNLRSALEYCYAERAGLCIDMASNLLYHWVTSYHLGEGRDWLEQGLADPGIHVEIRSRALASCGWLAIMQGDPASATRMLAESRALAEQNGLEHILGYVASYSGTVAMHQGDSEAAVGFYTEAVTRHRAVQDPLGEVLALTRLALAYSSLDESERAVAAAEKAMAICDVHGERWQRAYAMTALGIQTWRQGDPRRAASLERESLRFNRLLGDTLGMGLNIEALAWIAAGEGDHERAGRLLGILGNLWEGIGARMPGYAYLAIHHEECVARTRQGLGEEAFRAAVERGTRLSEEEALDYALSERRPPPPAPSAPAVGDRWTPLTKRETEIARLVARGMSNKEIAASLVIAQRTAEGHVEHILAKLGFTSRTQIAAWVSEQTPP